ITEAALAINRDRRLAEARSRHDGKREQREETKNRDHGGDCRRELEWQQPGECPESELREEDGGKYDPGPAHGPPKPKPPLVRPQELADLEQIGVERPCERPARVDGDERQRSRRRPRGESQSRRNPQR